MCFQLNDMLVQRLIVVFTAFSALIKRSPEHRPPRSVLLYPCFAHPNFNTCSFSPSIYCIMHLWRFCFFGLCQQTTFNPVFTVIAKLTVKKCRLRRSFINDSWTHAASKDYSRPRFGWNSSRGSSWFYAYAAHNYYACFQWRAVSLKAQEFLFMPITMAHRYAHVLVAKRK